MNVGAKLLFFFCDSLPGDTAARWRGCGPHTGGEREVRGGQWDQNTLCAAQREPER